MFEERKNRVSHKKREEFNETLPQVQERLAVEPVPVRGGESYRVGQIFWKATMEVVLGILDGGRIVRLVGPNDRPLERYEFENVEYRTQQPRGGLKW